MAYKRRCWVCDAEFETLDYRVRMCSDDCREVRKRIKEEQYRQTEKERELTKRMRERAAKVRQRMHLLSEDAREADEHGMTYGQYWAKMRDE